MIIGILIGFKLAPVSNFKHDQVLNFNKENYNKISDVINYIKQDYVDSMSRTDLNENAIEGILKDLDPHSQYIPPAQLVHVNEHLMGNFEGIGVQFRIEDDTIVVLHIIKGGPSEKVGIQAGDRIVRINDSLIAGVGLDSDGAIKLLKGPKGSKVNVSIFRRDVNGLLDYTITRDVIPTYSLDIAYMVNDSTGFIKLNKFSATTYKEFETALKDLVNKGMTNLILDLRGNTGGYLQDAIKISDEFIEDKKLIVYTEGNNRPKNYAYATKKGLFEKGNIIILIDGGSASASEIVAGAVQDNDRGSIVGRRSFGKGLVQEQLNLPDGSAIRLTIARYYTPTGRCIQRSYENGNEEYYSEFHDRFMNGEMNSADSVHIDTTLKYVTPEGKIVYGGGGIMPDVYVPFDNFQNDEFLQEIFRKGTLFKFSFEYTDNHRKELEKYHDAESFNKDFEIDNDIFKEFLIYARGKGISTKNIKDKERIKLFLKAFIGRNLHDDKSFYPAFNKTDATFIKANEIIEKPF